MGQYFLHFAWHILVWFAAQPLLSWQQTIYLKWVRTTYLGILLLLAPRGFQSISSILVFTVICPKPPLLPAKTVKVLLDVGQGLASVQTRHRVGLILVPTLVIILI